MPIEVEWQLSCQNKKIHDLSSAGSEKKGLCIRVCSHFYSILK